MAIKLANLPYDFDALEPHISSETLSLHYERHHQGYVDKLNNLIEDTAYSALDLPDIVARAREKVDVDVFNNAAQAWNHAFYWESLSPTGEPEPEGHIKEMVEHDFGSIDAFRKEFRDAATSQFGSGWTWLVFDGGKLRVISTGNADTPLHTQMIPLLTLDVWEHAYYVDFRNERERYVETFLENLINWKFAERNLADIDDELKSGRSDRKRDAKAA